jgi:hypothetical protein
MTSKASVANWPVTLPLGTRNLSPPSLGSFRNTMIGARAASSAAAAAAAPHTAGAAKSRRLHAPTTSPARTAPYHVHNTPRGVTALAARRRHVVPAAVATESGPAGPATPEPAAPDPATPAPADITGMDTREPLGSVVQPVVKQAGPFARRMPTLYLGRYICSFQL